MNNTLIIIPSRMSAKRLPGKPLLKINDISIFEQYVSSEAFVEETLFENKIDLKFTINELETLFVDKINIFGNNVTKEEVIRNQLIVVIQKDSVKKHIVQEKRKRRRV